jgi:hypothetical protein
MKSWRFYSFLKKRYFTKDRRNLQGHILYRLDFEPKVASSKPSDVLSLLDFPPYLEREELQNTHPHKSKK